jgi:endonuclease/exonuclease/phosphatase family metal-dependent hydrolase
MPFYDDLRLEKDIRAKGLPQIFPELTDPERIRIIDGLIGLKPALKHAITPRQTEANLLVASWNLKEFGHTKQRLPDAYFFIAEILASFDLIAVQEIKSTLKDLEIVMRLLGPDWRYLVNDITEGAAGNRERSGYICNTHRVRLSGLAGEIAIPPELTSAGVLKQLKRSPYMTGFIAGWKKFAMINLHLHPGDATDDPNSTTDDHEEDDVALRREEVRLLMETLDEKMDNLWTQNLVLVGDMNLYKNDDDATVQMILDAGFSESTALAGKVTNVSLSQAYDRMFFRESEFFRLGHLDTGAQAGGVFNPFDHVYTEAEALQYRAEMIEAYGDGARDLVGSDTDVAWYFRNYWRKNQLSDHLPIWVELSIDDSSRFLSDTRAEIVAAAGSA